MRPHHLRVSAFGAFGGTVQVDLDRLSEAGLFLLHGPTGAGKTTLLDALGFALFGRVPGVRDGAKRLRSDHAPESARTEVCLEVSFGSRRFRVTRSPDYERPKLRGQGTTREKAKVLLEELAGGEWVFRSDRFDEAGLELGDLVGMSAEQFFQVVLLPQGEFAQFLRARSEDRARVLQRLFATERFGLVEQWLAGRRRATAEACAQGQDAVELLAARVAEAAGAEAPPEQEPLSWGHELLDAARAEEAAAAAVVGRRTAERETARAALDAAVALGDLQRRRSSALARREELDRRRPHLLALQAEADAAARAAEVTPLVAEVAHRRARRDDALAAEAVARSALVGAGLAPDLEPEALEAVVRVGQERTGALEALRAVDDARGRELAAAAEATAEEATALTEVAELEVLLAGLPRRREQAEAAARAGREAEQRRPVLLAEKERLEARRPDVVSLVQCETRLVVRREEHLAARQTHVALLEKANDLRTASINTMVARLASSLVADTPCPVCGSLEHPDPSSLRDEGVTTEDEEVARRAADDAALAVADVEARLAADRALAGALRERVDGLTPARVDEQLAELALELAVLDARATDGERAARDQVGLEEALREATARHVAASARAEAAARRAREAGARAAAAAQRLDAALDGAPDLDAALATEASRAAAASSALERTLALVAAQHELDQAVLTAERACSDRGFSCLDDAKAAARQDPWREGTATHLREAADALAAVEAELADPVLDVPLEPPAPVDERAAAVVAADALVAESTGAYARVQGRRTSLERLVPELGRALDELRPLQQEAAEVRRVADLCAGGGQNALRMTLSSYVLAARLEEVAAAASVRLRRMTQGRYELVHTDGAARGGARSGLGLLARDAWTGQDRDTATLSGGETFLASLALALGLADVVAAEAGGARVEALFVDEGFGTLDEETLDEVMDVLDGLREGGRVVGLVSHVAELRQRIPAQVEVRRTRSGSDVVLRGV